MQPPYTPHYQFLLQQLSTLRTQNQDLQTANQGLEFQILAMQPSGLNNAQTRIHHLEGKVQDLSDKNTILQDQLNQWMDRHQRLHELLTDEQRIHYRKMDDAEEKLTKARRNQAHLSNLVDLPDVYKTNSQLQGLLTEVKKCGDDKIKAGALMELINQLTSLPAASVADMVFQNKLKAATAGVVSCPSLNCSQVAIFSIYSELPLTTSQTYPDDCAYKAALAPMTKNQEFMKKQAAKVKKHKEEAERAAAGSIKLRIDNIRLIEEMKKMKAGGLGAKKGGVAQILGGGSARGGRGSSGRSLSVKKDGGAQDLGGDPAHGGVCSSGDAAMGGMDDDGLYGA
jgi:hypothetical protein